MGKAIDKLTTLDKVARKLVWIPRTFGLSGKPSNIKICEGITIPPARISAISFNDCSQTPKPAIWLEKSVILNVWQYKVNSDDVTINFLL